MNRFGMRMAAGLALCVVGVAAVGIADPARGVAAQEKDWYLAIDAAYNSKYVWRGIAVVDDHVFQPSVTIGYGNLSLNVWGSRDLTSENGSAGDFTEIDYTIDYSWSHDDLGFSVGAIYYDFPHDGGAGTYEVYGAASLDVMLSPTLTLYADIDEADGMYATFGVGHSFRGLWQPLKDVSLGLDVGASVGLGSSNYNDFYFGVDETALTDALVSVGWPLQIGERWTLTPSVCFSQLLDGDIRDALSNDSNMWGGISLAFSF